jgi:hypothetical protein
MGYFRKKIERRTFSQDRYYILIKRQKSGEATMRDLVELDEIVNRVPDIREKVLRENFAEFNAEDPGADNPTSGPEIQKQSAVRTTFWKRLGNFFKGWFTTDIHATVQKFSALC